jgi:hypothetical protein
MEHLVYKTYNPLTSEYYFGKHSTNDINDGYKGSGNWIKESDRNILITDIIYIADSEEDAYHYEKLVIFENYKDPLCMNIAMGGTGIKIGSHTSESKEKIRKALTGVKHTEERKINIGKGRKGKPHSQESKDKISKSLIGNQRTSGRKRTDKEKLNISNSLKGIKRSEETKRKISKSRTGKVEVKGKEVEINGIVYKSQSEASRLLNTPLSTLRGRINSEASIFSTYKKV